jgi:phage terminase large subunit
MLEFATKNDNRQVWYVAPNYKQAKSIMWAMLMDLIPPQAIERKNETELSVSLINGSQIFLKGAEDPDSLRGVRIDFCIFDECAFITKWDDVWKVMRPTLADSRAECWFISTPNGFNHFKDLAERDTPDSRYFHFTTYDNPYISRDEIEAMKMDMDEDSFQQEVMGEFRKMTGLVYKTFHRDTHMVDVPDITGYTIFRSLDFGFRHKAALGYFAVSPDFTAIYLFDGLYKSELGTDELSEVIKLKDSNKYITNAWGDSAQPQIIQDLLIKGVRFDPVSKGNDSVMKGIVDVAGLLKIRQDTGKPTLMIAKHLTWVADEFEQYRYITNKNENSPNKEMPLKRDDDAMDMIRYFAMSYNKQKPKPQLPKDDLFTEDGLY